MEASENARSAGTTLAIEAGEVVVAQARGRCRLCCHENKVIIAQGVCDACLLGTRYALKYECDRCHGVQRIPHPMWRYQPTPDAYGGATWACHGRCGDYTYWRVVRGDLARIPAQERPEAWGTGEWLREVRERRQQGGQRSLTGTSTDTIRGCSCLLM